MRMVGNLETLSSLPEPNSSIRGRLDLGYFLDAAFSTDSREMELPSLGDRYPSK